MARFDLSDAEWAVIAPLLPNKPRGVPRTDDRRVLNGIFWTLRTGSPWRDLPERYGPTRRSTIATTAATPVRCGGY
jgi:transposase